MSSFRHYIFHYLKERWLFNSFIFPISFTFLQHCPMFIFAYLINNQSLCYCECNYFSCNPYKLLCSYFLSCILFWGSFLWIKNCDVCCVCVCWLLYFLHIYRWFIPKLCQSVSQSVSSVTESCPTCDPVDFSMPGFAIHH